MRRPHYASQLSSAQVSSSSLLWFQEQQLPCFGSVRILKAISRQLFSVRMSLSRGTGNRNRAQWRERSKNIIEIDKKTRDTELLYSWPDLSSYQLCFLFPYVSKNELCHKIISAICSSVSLRFCLPKINVFQLV